MAIQQIMCGHCGENHWGTRCDGCERVIGREDTNLQLNSIYGNNLPDPIVPNGRQLVLCGGCASGGVDLLRLLSTPPKRYPDLVR